MCCSLTAHLQELDTSCEAISRSLYDLRNLALEFSNGTLTSNANLDALKKEVNDAT